MKENTIVESVNTYKKKIIPLTRITAIIAVIGLITKIAVQNPINSAEYTAHYGMDTIEVMNAYKKLAMLYSIEELGMFGIVIGASLSILLFVFYWYIAKMQIVVTDKRVYGKTAFGKQVDLPLDSISSVGTCLFKGIAVGTSSGKISFLGIGNRDNVYEEIKKILADRQKNEEKTVSSVTNITQEQSSADELKKYKDLLDSGIITQEEFDMKKRQLLGF